MTRLGLYKVQKQIQIKQYKLSIIIFMQTKNFRKQLLQSITSKSLAQIYKHIVNADIYSIESSEWRRYLIQIFAMLTDPQIQTPTFFRRTHIFSIFKIAIEVKMTESDGKDNGVLIKRNVPFLKRVVQAILMATTSHRNIDADMESSFHKFVQKILLNLTQFQEMNKQNLAQDKLKLLSQVYPVPNTRSVAQNGITQEFLYPDLLLWYQLCVQIENFLQFRYIGQEQLSQYLGKLRSQVQNIRQPVLKLIFIYNLVQQTIKVRGLFQQNQSVAQKCLKIGILIMTEIRENVMLIFNIKQSGTAFQQLAQNVYHCMIRFNVILVTFILLQKLSKSSHFKLILSLIKQIKSNLAIISIHSSKRISYFLQNQNSQKPNQLVQKYFKYSLECYWIDYHISKLQSQIQAQYLKGYHNSKLLHLGDGMYIQPKQVNQMLESQINKNQTKLEDFEQILINQISNYRGKKAFRFSEKVKMSTLVNWSLKLLQENPNLFQQILSKILTPIEGLSFTLSLLTQFHFNQNILIALSINFAQQVLFEYLSHPESIKEHEQIQLIKHSVYTLRLCILKDNHNYLCSLCAVLQISQFCQYCGQACGKFIYPEDLDLSLRDKWEQWVKMLDYFVNNEKHQLREVIGAQLLEQLRLATLVRN